MKIILKISLFKTFLSVAVFTFSGCASSDGRVLGRDEALRYGLTGVIYDAPLCPTKVRDGVSQVTGACEYVTCEPASGKLVCRARKFRKY